MARKQKGKVKIKMLRKFEIDMIESFWNWIENNKDYVGVQYSDESHFYLYIAFDTSTINSFTDTWQYFCEEDGCACKLQMNCICFDVADVMSGYGFSMSELWENRPDRIEDILGTYLY